MRQNTFASTVPSPPVHVAPSYWLFSIITARCSLNARKGTSKLTTFAKIHQIIPSNSTLRLPASPFGIACLSLSLPFFFPSSRRPASTSPLAFNHISRLLSLHASASRFIFFLPYLYCVPDRSALLHPRPASASALLNFIHRNHDSHTAHEAHSSPSPFIR